MIAYLDTSALARRYLAEPGSERVRALLRGSRRVAVSRLAFAELCAGVARACRLGTITESQRDAIFRRVPDDFAALEVVEPRRAVVERVPALVLAHPLRAYDALQLASCLTLKAAGLAVELWSNDGELNAAAKAEGLKTVAL